MHADQTNDRPRVWDRFLTADDRAVLAAGWGKSEPFGLGDRPAIVVIDNTTATLAGQEATLHRVLTERPLSYGIETARAIGLTAQLLDEARSRAVPVFFTVVRPQRWGLLRHERFWNAVNDPRFGEVLPELNPAADDIVIAKTATSGFFETPLSSFLTNLGVNSVLVCGNSTSGCVRATAVDSVSHGFLTAVIEDCTFDRSELQHAISLYDLHHKYADVISYDEALAYLTSFDSGVSR